MRNSIVTLTLLSLFAAAPAWADDPPPAPDIANRCDLDCFHRLVRAYAEQHEISIPRAEVTERFREADADGNGILGRQERERLANELPGFFLPFVLLDDNDALRGPGQGRRGGVLVGTPADSIRMGAEEITANDNVDQSANK